MADESKENEASSVADEWDLPPLISSVYVTQFFQRGLEPINLPGFGDMSTDQPCIFVSDGFVFPPSEHENLPIEPDVDEVNSNDDGKEDSCAGNNDDGEEDSCAGNNDECCYVTAEEVDDMNDEKLSAASDLSSAIETTYPDSKTPEAHAKQKKDHIACNSDLPCEGWWKKEIHLYISSYKRSDYSVLSCCSWCCSRFCHNGSEVSARQLAPSSDSF